jgi:hypothetical protein
MSLIRASNKGSPPGEGVGIAMNPSRPSHRLPLLAKALATVCVTRNSCIVSLKRFD